MGRLGQSTCPPLSRVPTYPGRLKRQIMNPNQPIQFQCRECQVIFTLCVDRTRDTEYVEPGEKRPVDYGLPICCPFWGMRT